MPNNEPKAWYMDERFWFNEPGFHQFPKINAIIAEAERRQRKTIREEVEALLRVANRDLEETCQEREYYEEDRYSGQIEAFKAVLDCLKDE